MFDIGLDVASLNELSCSGEVEIRTFDFSKHPKFMRIEEQDAGAYAWKPLIVKEISSEFDIVLWSDAGNRWNASLDPFIDEAKRRNGLYSGNIWGRLGQLMHPGMYAGFYNDSSFASMFVKSHRNCDAAFVVFTKEAQDFVHEWSECAKVKACILPRGANRKNHRQASNLRAMFKN